MFDTKKFSPQGGGIIFDTIIFCLHIRRWTFDAIISSPLWKGVKISCYNIITPGVEISWWGWTFHIHVFTRGVLILRGWRLYLTPALGIESQTFWSLVQCPIHLATCSLFPPFRPRFLQILYSFFKSSRKERLSGGMRKQPAVPKSQESRAWYEPDAGYDKSRTKRELKTSAETLCVCTTDVSCQICQALWQFL